MRSSPAALGQLIVLAALGACSRPMDPAAESPATDALREAARLPFHEDGTTEPFQIPRAAGRDTMVIRIRLGSELEIGGRYCLQLVDVVASNGERWVSDGESPDTWGYTCRSCEQRVFSSMGTGLFVFPNNGLDLGSDIVGLSARVALRDCATRAPFAPTAEERQRLKATVEAAGFEVGAARSLSVAVYVAAPPALADATSLGGSLLEEGLAVTAAHWANAGLIVHFDDPMYAQEPTEAVVEVGPENLGAIDDLVGESALALGGTRASGATLILVPCLRAKALLSDTAKEVDGFTPRIPGGFAADGYGDAILVRTSTCVGAAQPYWLSPSAFGRVVAHEIGHYLGLYHVDAPEGLDTHVADVQWDNLMNSIPSSVGEPAITSQQAHVAIHHPLVR